MNLRLEQRKHAAGMAAYLVEGQVEQANNGS